MHLFRRDFVIRSVHAQDQGPAENVQRTAVARCEHAIVVVGSETLPVLRLDFPDAETVVFGKDGEGIDTVANEANKMYRLGQNELSDVLRMEARAKEHDRPLLVRLGNTNSYAVYDPGNRSIAEGWAVVQCEVDLPGEASAARTTRRTAAKKNSQSFRCKVS